MSEDIKEVEKIENEIELNEEEREKLKEFLKENLDIMLKSKESIDKNDNTENDSEKKIEGIKLYENLKVFCGVNVKSQTSDIKNIKYPYRLAFKHLSFNKEHSGLSRFNNKPCLPLESSIYPAFYLYTNKKDNKKHIILAFGYWAGSNKKSPISWDEILTQNFFSIKDYFEDKNKKDIEEIFKEGRITHEEAILYSAYLIEDGLENYIDKMVNDLEEILKYYISYVELYMKYQDRINNDKEIKEKDLREILKYYIDKEIRTKKQDEYKKEIEEYNKKFFEFSKTIQKFDGDFSFPSNIILYGTSKIENIYNTILYSLTIIERNKKIYENIENLKNYTNFLERFKGYIGNGQIELVSSNKAYTYENFKKACEKVKNDKYNNNYILIIENIDKRDKLEIFGEYFSELKKRVYNKEESNIPKNLYILGIINTLSGYRAFLNLEFFNNFNFEKMYSKAQIIENIGEIDKKNIENDDNFKFPLNTILYGPPGTGKTYNSILYSLGIATKDGGVINRIKNNTETISDEKINEFNDLKKQGQIEFITFHQSYSYEDFVEGIRPTLATKDSEDNKDLKYTIHSGIFKKICERARNDKDKNYVLIIDEINRGNISKIFGELITLLEPSKRLGETEELKIRLPYSGEEFGVPKNLYILGTMNTADRSIALLDIALRRRFNFIEMSPRYELLKQKIEVKNDKIELQELLKAINTRIEFLLDKDHLIGHSYFINIKTFEDLKEIFRNSIIPLLQEYFYDDFEKIREVLNIGDNNDSFIIKKEIPQNFSDTLKTRFQNKPVYVINETEIEDKGFNSHQNYTKIYN